MLLVLNVKWNITEFRRYFLWAVPFQNQIVVPGNLLVEVHWLGAVECTDSIFAER